MKVMNLLVLINRIHRCMDTQGVLHHIIGRGIRMDGKGVMVNSCV
jgi:hypothetical protein